MFKCTLGVCTECPSYLKNNEEIGVFNDFDDLIRFEHYVRRQKCTLHAEIPIDAKICDSCALTPDSKKKRIGKLYKKNLEIVLNGKYKIFF